MYFQCLPLLLLVITSDMRPSQDSYLQDKLFNFVGDINCRFFYSKVLNFEKDIQKLNSINLFLQSCIEENIIPNTFKVSNKPQGNVTEERIDNSSEAIQEGRVVVDLYRKPTDRNQ